MGSNGIKLSCAASVFSTPPPILELLKVMSHRCPVQEEEEDEVRDKVCDFNKMRLLGR